MNGKVLFVIIVLAITPFVSFCQTTVTDVDLTIPNVVPDQAEQDMSSGNQEPINRNAFKQSIFNLTFLAYRAVREENISLCAGDEMCSAIVPLMADMRKMSQGKCNSVANSLTKELCEKLTTKTCDAFTVGWKKDYCWGMARNNPGLLNKSIKDAGAELSKGTGLPISPGDAVIGLAVYNGYAKSSMSACESVISSEKLPLSRKIACKLIFSDNFERTSSQLLDDVVLFHVSRSNNDMVACDRINNADIKRACKDKSITRLEDVW